MSECKTVYEMMELGSGTLVVPEKYQRRLNADRVARIVTAFDERIANEPKVSFRDGKYFIFDGQHTVIARKIRNSNIDLPILCKVYRGMTEDEEALLFAAQTGESAPLTPSAALRAKLHGKDPDAAAFVKATEDAGLHIGYERAPGIGRITCINTAFSEFLRVGADVYTEALSVIHDAWGGAPESLRIELLQAVISFVKLYHGEYDRTRLVKQLQEHSPLKIYMIGTRDKSLRGKKKYLNLIFRIYNTADNSHTLPIRF